ncbi:MAG: FtsX-like permease family protein [Bryobacteraceae bacterium]
MKALAAVFARLILRPLRNEPVRTTLNVLAVALGVAVVIAIDLAGDAAAGSFRSSMDTLAGKASFEIVGAGGIDEKILGKLAAIPMPLRFVPRIESFALIGDREANMPLIGLDLFALDEPPQGAGEAEPEAIGDLRSIWVSGVPGAAAGGKLRLSINGRATEYKVRGTLPAAEPVVLMDIAAAQTALARPGLVDRIEVHVPDGIDAREEIEKALPPGVELRSYGSKTEENRKMLNAFRWNLRVLSYISLVVGAFLIYNTIAVSVVRRRAEVGVLRALGATRMQVRLAFLVEAGMFGLAGAVLGLALGRLMAEGAVRMLGRTVQSLYVSSAPGAIDITWITVAQAFAIAFGATLLSAWGPAHEASQVAPVEAMARGYREVQARARLGLDLTIAIVLSGTAYWLTTLAPWQGRPMGGYAACLLLIAAAAFLIPAMVQAASRVLAGFATLLLRAPGRLATRGIAAALPRTSVLVAALATAVAMMVSVGIMVGSFRETVNLWMESQLRADLYLRPAGGGGAGKYPVMPVALADAIAKLQGVRAVDRFRIYEISYGGLPALFGGGETSVIEGNGRMEFLSGQNREEILKKLPTGDFSIVSEPFANKHLVEAGDRIEISLATGKKSFEVLGVYYDYSNERGYVIVDRKTLLRHLPDTAISNMAVYVDDPSSVDAVRERIAKTAAGQDVLVFSNANLREEALRIFDRTFAITWALEAVAVVVAVLGIAGALVTLVIDRRREMGLLRFLGASPGQVRSLVLTESGLLGLLSIAAGFALGYALSLILIYVINRQSFGWTISFHWPEALLASTLALIFFTTVLAGIYPARVAVRLNPIEVIHEE